MSGPARPQLVRALSLRDVVLFNVAAILGLRHLATTAHAGPGALTLWILAAIFFFVPQAIAVVRLSALYPESGGIYEWTRNTFGEAHGFFSGWCYWVCNILYYPNLLISTAVIATFVIGRGESGLENNVVYVATATLVALAIATALNVVGVGTGKWLQNIGGVGAYVPGVVLATLGIWAVLTRPPATTLDVGDLVPKFRDLSTLNLWAAIAFAYAGLELSSAMGGEIRDPRRSLARGVYISAPLIAAIYFAGTLSLLWLVPAGNINIVSGFLQGIAEGAARAGPWLLWLVPFSAAAYTIGNLGTAGAWLSGPARLDRYFPPAFGKVHPRWRTPHVAIFVQAGTAAVFLVISLLGRGTTVEDAYLMLLLTSLLIYFIPYLYMFAALFVHARRGSPGTKRLADSIAAASGIAMTALAMILAAVPGTGESALLFELKVVGGTLFFVIVGLLIFRRGRRQHVDA
jgi:glutamate:GABA antiporter